MGFITRGFQDGDDSIDELTDVDDDHHNETDCVASANAAEIEQNWPTGTRKTARYFHGILPYREHIEFLTEWRAQSLAGGHTKTKKGKKRGQISQIRSAMRSRYPGWHTNLNTIRAALRSKAEWGQWSNELFGERKAKLKERKEQKKKRKAEREKKQKSGAGSHK